MVSSAPPRKPLGVAALVQEHQQVGAVVERHVGAPVGQRRHVLGVGGRVLAPARLDRHPRGRQRRRHLVLGGERVGRAERGLGAAGGERGHQVGRLGGHVQAGGHLDSLERPLLVEAPPDRAEHRHLAGSPLDPGRSRRGEARIGDV